MLRLKLKANFRQIESERRVFTQKALAVATRKLLTELANATPVDTGLAKASWTMSPGRPGAYYITNEVPYIGVLNEGHSLQAPAHFIEHTALKYGRPLGIIAQEIDT